MATQLKLPALSVLALAAALLSCEGLNGDADLAIDTAAPTPPPPTIPAQVATVSPQAAPAETVPTPVATPAPRPKVRRAQEPSDAVEPDRLPPDPEPVRKAAEAFAARTLYLNWAPDPLDDGNARVCYGSAEEGQLLSAAWGLARARVMDVTFDDSVSVATAQIEVVRVLSVQGDPETSDGDYARLDMMVVKPVLDTMDVTFRRREEGDWVQCRLYNRGRLRAPISLTGPPVDTLLPRGVKLTRIVPAWATWKRVRELADSIGRG